MRPVDEHQALGLICNGQRCWGIFVSIGWRSAGPPAAADARLEHIHRAAPVLNRPECTQIIIDGQGILLFDTECEMLAIFRSIVGDDGPTETNPYEGPCCVSAITADPEGRLGYENT